MLGIKKSTKGCKDSNDIYTQFAITHKCSRIEAKLALFPIIYAYSTSIEDIKNIVEGEN